MKKQVYIVLMEDRGIPGDPEVFADIDDWNDRGSALLQEQGFGQKEGESSEDHLNAYFEVASDWYVDEKELSEVQRELKADREDTMRHGNVVLRMWECDVIEKGDAESEFILPSGAKGWKDRLHAVYDHDREQWEAYDKIYGLAARLGFASADDAWYANPLICGGTNPEDFGLVEPEKAVVVSADAPVEVVVEPKELSTDEMITKLQAFSVMPELILDGCGFNFAYYGVQSGSQPPVDPELIKEVETLLTTLINGFSKFCNFTSDGRLRYMCNYSHGTRGVPFVGVAYWKVEDAIKWIEKEQSKEKGDE